MKFSQQPEILQPQFQNFFENYNLLNILDRLEEDSIPVCRAANGYFGYDENGNDLFATAVMNKDRAVRLFEKIPDSAIAYSMRNRRVKIDYSLIDQFRYLNQFNSKYSMRMWATVGESQTPLHYDASNNVIICISGTKIITFFSPEKFASLYAYENSFKRGHVSRVNFGNIDRNEFPNFPKSPDLKLVLREGEAMYIPSFWWHYVESSERSLAVNYSLNTVVNHFFLCD